MTSLENFEVGKLVQDMIDHARFCPHSGREGDREKDRVEVRDSLIFSFPGASWEI